MKVNRDFLGRASNGVDRLMKIVEDLDMITKLESGVMELRVARMDLYASVKETMEAMEITATRERRSPAQRGRGASDVLADLSDWARCS